MPSNMRPLHIHKLGGTSVASADPRVVPAAFTLRDLSYREATKMAYSGAKVLQKQTLAP